MEKIPQKKNNIILDLKLMCKAVEARRERTKRINDNWDNEVLICSIKAENNFTYYIGEYSKDQERKKKLEHRLWFYFWLIISIMIVYAFYKSNFT